MKHARQEATGADRQATKVHRLDTLEATFRAMTGVGDIAPKLDPLIRRLATDRDGERLACVVAIQRQLDRAGLSLHDLADRLLTAPEPAAGPDGTPVFTDYAEAVEWLLTTDCGELSAREIRFCEDMRGILARFDPTPKQVKWLAAIVSKLGGELRG